MGRFRIRWRDPQTNEWEETIKEFDDSPPTDAVPGVSAAEWAEDWAYMAADKGPHSVEELRAPSS